MALQKHHKDFKHLIDERTRCIVEDHHSGATTLGLRTLRIAQAISARQELTSRARQKWISGLFKDVITAHPQMGILRHLRETVAAAGPEDRLSAHELRKQITKYRDDNASAFARHCRRGSSILTISFSSAVHAALVAARRKWIHVIVPESRPKNEGRSLAAKLAESKIKTTLIVDAAAGLFINEVDYVVLGCDALTRDYFINKIGSLALCLLAKEAGVPVYVFADPYRVIEDEKSLRKQINHAPAEITRAEHDYEINNRYFDFVPNTLVSRFMYDGRLRTPEKLFKK